MYKIVERSEECQYRDRLNKQDKVAIYKGKKFIQNCNRMDADKICQQLVEDDNWNAANRD